MTETVNVTEDLMFDPIGVKYDRIWLFPEQGDPRAGEWFWTAVLVDLEPEEQEHAIAYTRTEATRQAEADKAELVKALRELLDHHEELGGGISMAAQTARQTLAKHGGRDE